VLPDDPGHLVAVHFDDRIDHFDFRHGERDPCSAEWMGKAIGTVRGRWVRPLRQRRRYSIRAAAEKGVAVISGRPRGQALFAAMAGAMMPQPFPFAAFSWLWMPGRCGRSLLKNGAVEAFHAGRRDR
jgi:hypothetical protein